MTDNDMAPIPSPGHWVHIDPSNSAAVMANPTVAPQYIQRITPMETTPTSGIVLDQKVLIALVLVLGAVAGIILMMILDKYASKSGKQEFDYYRG
jgi:hypothetical protein